MYYLKILFFLFIKCFYVKQKTITIKLCLENVFKNIFTKQILKIIISYFIQQKSKINAYL